ncbi:alanine racemase [Dactylosporangium sp. CA-233914]|uniref:alanine racemase n=1 Tax=Dactylosporangium sp. CA-233914 TaxID=3239934 RepID=UPI003D8B5295
MNVLTDGAHTDLGEYVGQSLRAGSVPLPVMAVRLTALEDNVARLASYCRDHELLLAPHAKTHLTAQIAQRQLAGAWGLTAANVQQAEVELGFGARRVLIANEVTGRASIDRLRRLLDADPGARVHCLVDSAVGVDLLDAGFASAAAPLGVLVEFGHLGRRAGARDAAAALAVAERVVAADHLELVGVGMFEGAVAADRSPAALERIDAAVGGMVDFALDVDRRGLFSAGGKPIVTAGGTLFFDHVVEAFARLPRGRYDVILRSGAYVVHDDRHYRELSPLPFTPALEVWADVLSVPERHLAIIGAGKRDVPWDQGLPVVKGWVRNGERRPAPPDWVVTDTNDQHAFVRIGEDAPVPGDIVVLGISHPCTAFDRWRSVLAVTDEDVVTACWPTYFS